MLGPFLNDVSVTELGKIGREKSELKSEATRFSYTVGANHGAEKPLQEDRSQASSNFPEGGLLEPQHFFFHVSSTTYFHPNLYLLLRELKKGVYFKEI